MRNILKRIFTSYLILSLLLPIVPWRPVSPALADAPPFPSPDIDGDGLPNWLETAGWYNLAGGPFLTDPLNPDTDSDGLSDGEEKLYGGIDWNPATQQIIYGGTNPLDNTSPGLFIRYDSNFKTREYFSSRNELERDDYNNWTKKYLPMLQGGDKYLMTEAMVVRRGATFQISGPVGASLTIQGSGLTPLTPVRNTCQSSWSVSIPAGGTTGTYIATMSLGGVPIKSIPIHVIFEFPNDLTQAEIEAYIYDDDPANKRDEVSVWWRTPDWSYYFPGYSETTLPDCSLYPNSACSNWQYHLSQGYAQAFWTEQFTQKVFVQYAMPAIQGKTSPAEAVYSSGDNNDLLDTADREFRTVYVNTHNNWSDALRKVYSPTLTAYTMDGGACQDNANVFTTLLRSAGIAAKPFLQDYNKTTGHGEGGQIGSVYEYDHAVMIWRNNHWQIARSYSSEERNDPAYPYYNGRVNPRELPGFYGDYAADLIITSDHRWDWQNGSNGGGMVNTVWDDQAEGVPSPEFSYPNSNWDIEWYSHKPLEISRSPYATILNNESWYNDGWAPGEWRTDPGPNCTQLASPPYVWNHCSNPAGTVITQTPPGRVATQTYVLPSGVPSSTAPLENWPYNPVPVACSPSSAGTPDCQAIGVSGLSIQEGANTSRMTFVAPRPKPSKEAHFNDQFSHQALDTNGNGQYDSLVIDAGLEVTTPGTFKVEGDLYDGRGNLVGHAEWTGSGPQAVLQFDIANSSPPYILEHLRLYNSNGSLLSSRYYKAYEITSLGGPVEQGAISISGLPGAPGDLSTLDVTSTQAFTTTTVDSDGNGRIDQLVVRAGVNVTDSGGAYRIEGLLVDEAGRPVAWSVSEPQTLAVGSGELELTFDGRIIHDQLPFAPATQALKLVAVKIFSGSLSPATLEDQVEVALTTPAYTRNQFESATSSGNASSIFEDNMENGSGNWTPGGSWSLGGSVWYSPSHAWQTTASGSLATISLDASNYVRPALRFKTCYNLPSANTGYVELFNGAWTRVATYTNSTQPWATKPLDLSAFGKTTDLRLRFNANASGGGLAWYIDDVELTGYPAITAPSFTYSPQPALANRNLTLTAAYSSLDTTLPVTYTWDFNNDGLADEISNSPTILHQFAAGNHPVQLTVANPYDQTTVSQIITVGEPVTATSFSSNPATPLPGVPINFTAAYLPVTATLPITYTWNFGDGITATTTNQLISHTYMSGGNYIVALTTTNYFGTAWSSQFVRNIYLPLIIK